jgi:hypothetical protein
VIIANYNDMSNYDMLVTRKEADAMGLFLAGDPRSAVSASSAEGAGAQTGHPTGSSSTRDGRYRHHGRRPSLHDDATERRSDRVRLAGHGGSGALSPPTCGIPRRAGYHDEYSSLSECGTICETPASDFRVEFG